MITKYHALQSGIISCLFVFSFDGLKQKRKEIKSAWCWKPKTLHFVIRNEWFPNGALSRRCPIWMSGVSLLTVETGQTYSMKQTVYRQHQPCKEAPTAVDVSKPWLLVHIVIISSFYASCSKCHPLWWVSKDEVIEGKTNTSIDISGHGTFSGQVHF